MRVNPTMLALIVAAMTMEAPAFADDVPKPPGITATGIRLGQTMPYSGPASSFSPLGLTEAAYYRMVSATASDQFQTAVLQNFNRTETADAIRQLGWQICQAWSNRGITDAQYQTDLSAIIKGAFDTLGKKASGATPLVAGAGSVSGGINRGPGTTGGTTNAKTTTGGTGTTGGTTGGKATTGGTGTTGQQAPTSPTK